jgi:hypothetical protein
MSKKALVKQDHTAEPVAKVGYKTIGGNVGISTVIYEIYTAGRDPLQAGDLLYTRPQNRTWVRLTDDDIEKAYEQAEKKEPYMGAVTRKGIAEAFEQILKEKNT